MYCDPINLFHEKPFRLRADQDFLLIAQAADALPDSVLAKSDDEALAGRIINAGGSMDLNRSDYDRIVGEGFEIRIEDRELRDTIAVWETRWYSGFELLHLNPFKRGGQVYGWITVDMDTIPTVYIPGYGDTEEEARSDCRRNVIYFHKYVRALLTCIDDHDKRCISAAHEFVRNRRKGIRNIPDFQSIAA